MLSLKRQPDGIRLGFPAKYKTSLTPVPGKRHPKTGVAGLYEPPDATRFLPYTLRIPIFWYLLRVCVPLCGSGLQIGKRKALLVHSQPTGPECTIPLGIVQG